MQNAPPTSAKIRFYNAIRKLRPIQVGEAIKKLAGIRRFYFKTASGLTYWIDPVSNLGLFLLNDGAYEPPMTDAIKSILRPGDTFIDIGANEGYFSMMAASIVGATGSVHAIEPQSRLQEVIGNNTRANGVEKIVHLHHLGFAESDGEKNLFLTADVNTGASSFTKHWKVGTQKETIRTTTLDAFAKANGLERIRLAKLDCEGAEVAVIAGAKQLLAAGKIERLILEYHPHIIGQAACGELHERILKLGYDLLPNTGALKIYTPKPS